MVALKQVLSHAIVPQKRFQEPLELQEAEVNSVLYEAKEKRRPWLRTEDNLQRRTTTTKKEKNKVKLVKRLIK